MPTTRFQTVRVKKFEHVGAGGPCMVRSKLNKLEHVHVWSEEGLYRGLRVHVSMYGEVRGIMSNVPPHPWKE